ncbi:hypothetical protein [Alteromonas sp. C1M14]|uniref:hypothetical protein n=1 Tax=Alteromonas sp. C1M14 TaxID=2841567 RepID=UPI001C09E714|nr:hypothetical protein [Alteromonas sp. C1M14]MBU2977839.1 hypothetical protein [Alteromonas sp. C1M14]
MNPVIEELAAKDKAITQALSQPNNALKSTKLCLDLANILIRCGKENSDILLGLVYLNDSDMSSPARSASLMTFVGLQQQFNDHYLQHLIAATYAASHLANQSADSLLMYVKVWREKQLVLFVEAAQLTRIYGAKSALHGAKSALRYLNNPALNFNQRWMVLVLCLLQATSLGFYPALKMVFPHLPYELQGAMQGFLRYPGPFLPAMTVTEKDKPFILIQRINVQNGLIWDKDKHRYREVLMANLSPVNAPKLAFNDWQKRLDNATQQHPHTVKLLPVSYPISRLPSDLKHIINQLQDDNIHLNTLVKNIANTPLLANYLKETASTDNRMQLPVRDVKQAILTYGLTRVADMLVLRTLTDRLQQKYFPLLPYCVRINTLCSSIASQLAVMSPATQLAPQSAALLASFYTSPLFTLPALKVRKRWPKSQGLLFSVDSFVTSKKPLHEMAIALLKQWQQPARYQSIVAHSVHFIDTVPHALRAESALIGLSLLLARHWLTPNQLTTDNHVFLVQAQAQLSINNQHIEQIKDHLDGQLFSPLTY